MTRKVYIVQDQQKRRGGERVPKFDFSPAEKFGELVFLLDPEVSPFEDSDAVVERLHAALRDFTSDDYLLLVGNPCFIGWATAIAAVFVHGPIQQLQFSSRPVPHYLDVSVDLLIF